MLHRRIAETKGFRSLSASELETVAGGIGEIIVTGRRPGDPDFGGGGSGFGGGGNETGNSPDPALDPNGGGGSFELPTDISINPNEGTVDLSVEVEEGLILTGTIDLDGFTLEKLSLSFLNGGNELNFDLNINSLQFGVDTLFDLGGGVTLRAMLQLDNDGTFSNGSVIFTVVF
ncbi:hypothetical protein J3454_02770 [Erythrobacter sp. NFXS35]|uniref:hypothetical protein n=1 Tax=Erythrobacter sp. NFXS35 TaxID=2818436 RepID=UPI0032E03082